MGDKQNPKRAEGESPADGPAPEKSGEAPRIYYYDDATGYEIYEAKEETDEDVDEHDG
jgi:hypothetical protein